MVPVLVALLADRDDQIRFYACNVLAHIGAEADAAVDSLIPMLSDANLYRRRNAASTLAHIGANSRKAKTDLIDALRDDDPFVNWHAAMALAEMGDEAKEAVPALLDLLRSDQSENCTSAIRGWSSPFAIARSGEWARTPTPLGRTPGATRTVRRNRISPS